MAEAAGRAAAGAHEDDVAKVGTVRATDTHPWMLWAAMAIAALTVWRLATLWISGHDLFFDEAQYWDWSRDLAFGYYSKPPVVAWLIAASTAICGDGEPCIRAGTPVVNGMTALVVGALGQLLFGPRAGFWSAITFALLPGVTIASGVVSTDTPLLLFWSIALYAWARLSLANGGFVWWIVLGVALGLAFLSKYAAFYFLIGVALHLAISADARRAFSPAGGGVAIVLTGLILFPNVLWNARHGFVSFVHLGENANLGGSLFNPDRMFEFLGSQFGVFGPITFAALLVVVVMMRRVCVDPRHRMLLSFVLPALVIITVQALLSRAHANWAAVSYVSATVLVAAWMLETVGRQRLLRVATALHVLFALLAYTSYPALRAANLELPGHLDPFARLQGWSELGERVSRHVEAYPDAELVTSERMILTELLYYVHPRPDQVIKWNPDGLVEDHYHLTTRMGAPGSGPYLLVTRAYGAGHVERFFDRLSKLEEVRIQTHEDRGMRFEVWLLDGFRGYDPA